jgi:carbon-monoxide dehydrogenase large subunit
MTAAKPETLSVLDRPNSYIGKTVPRPNLDRLMQGRGLYVSDIELPRMVHVVFLRSPHAHAKILGIDASAARHMPGVVAVITGQELAAVITPWVGVLSHLKGLKSAPQSAIAIDRVCWQGEAVAAIATPVATKMSANLKAMKKRMTGKRSKRNFNEGYANQVTDKYDRFSPPVSI